MRSATLEPELQHRVEGGAELPFVVWRFARPRRVLSSAPVGGGLGLREWVINAQVQPGYSRTDLDDHVDELARSAGLTGPGIGLLTAADADRIWTGEDDGVRVWASVGVRIPVWAAESTERAPADRMRSGSHAPTPGTINVVAELAVPMTDAALVNLVVTATEAKTQALLELGIDGTGTATDAVCLITSEHSEPSGGERFGGPRSRWGAGVARAVHDAVRQGTAYSRQRIHLEDGRH